MAGEGMVNFAVFVVVFFRKIKSPVMIGFEQSTLPVTEGIGGCSSVPPNFGPGLATAVTPSELRHEIQVPPVAAELAVGDGLEAHRLLFLNCILNAFVFQGF